MRVINFKTNDHPADALYHFDKIVKIIGYIKLRNCMFIKNVLARNSLSNFQGTFKLANKMHHYHTRHATNNSVILPITNTVLWNPFDRILSSIFLEYLAESS